MTGVAVVGTGFGCYTHVRALRASGFDVHALVGRDRAKTAERARLFGVPKALGSLQDALALSGVDAVTIATPPVTHAELALEAIEAGRHVICEKPFTATLDEAHAVLAASEEAGVVHLLGTEFRWDAGQAGLAQVVREGVIGMPRMATWIMHVPVLADPTSIVPAWWADAASRGGWMWAHGSQLIDQIRMTLGEFDGVSAHLAHVVDRPSMSADDGFVVHFRMCNGTIGAMQSTAGDWGVLVETRVTGSRGAAWIEGVGATVKVAGPEGVQTFPVPDGASLETAPPLPEGAVTTTYEQMITFGVEYGPYTRLTAAFRDLIEGRDPTGPRPATFVDGVAQMAVLEAIMESAAQDGQWTSVPWTGHSPKESGAR
jgi:predicted dehydrogenase